MLTKYMEEEKKSNDLFWCVLNILAVYLFIAIFIQKSQYKALRLDSNHKIQGFEKISLRILWPVYFLSLG